MSCPSCSHENPADARFCNRCGAPLGAAGAAPDPRPRREARSYTPYHLVEKILASKSALEGERKSVTVLFADVAGSMDLAERVGPEEWHRLLDRLFRILAGGIHRYEGTINQFTGDGVMALFGAPIAHEDHAERACAAALDLTRDLAAFAREVRRESGLELALRMGLNSGEVVVGRIGDDLRMDYTAQGHVVGLADRVQRLAPPGGVSLTEHTARLVAGFYELDDRGEQRVKGASGPIRVFDLRGPGPVRSRLERSRARGFSRFVGRVEELALLEAALDEARSGRAKVVVISGEPGAGKSRLCHQLVARSRGIAHHFARAPSHGRMLPFHVIAELGRGLFALGEGVDGEEIRAAVSRGLASARVDDSIAASFWLELLGAADSGSAPAELDPAARRGRLFASLCDLVAERARRAVVVLWIDDLQWLDPASEEAVAMLVERLLAADRTGGGVLLLATARPEGRPTWLARAEHLALAPLPATDAASLLDDWLGTEPTLAPLRARIAATARGNPLFVEEIVLSLVERGALTGSRGAYRSRDPVAEVPLPETIQAVLASRIDRLSPDGKEVLQTAAVIGPEAPVELLRAVLDLPELDLAAALERLAIAELIGPADVPGEIAFRHPLTREVAYHAQLLERRRRTHARVARTLIAMQQSRGAADAALLAHHFEEAGESLEAARWHERAGRRIARSDPDEGARHCREVAKLLAAVPASRDALTLELTSRIALLEIGRIAGIAAAEAQDLFGQASSFAERLGDRGGQAFLLTSYGRLRGLAGDVAEYFACAERAAEIAASAGDAVLELEMRTALAHAELGVGRLAGARATAERALGALAADADLRASVARSTAPALCLIWWALASAYLGRGAEAQRGLEGLLEDEEEGGLEVLYGTRGFLCEVLRLRGDLDAAVENGRRALDLAVERGSPLSRVEAAAFFGAAALAVGDVATAILELEAALDLARSRHTALWYEPRLLASLADARLAVGDRGAAARFVAEATACIERGRGWRLSACDVALARARVLAADPDPDLAAVASALDSADALAADFGADAYRRIAELERARLTRA